MTEKTKPAIDPEIAALEAKVNNLIGMMEIVDKKARIDGHVSDALFNVIRRYRLFKRDGK
jgi:hypothetical protein